MSIETRLGLQNQRDRCPKSNRWLAERETPNALSCEDSVFCQEPSAKARRFAFPERYALHRERICETLLSSLSAIFRVVDK